MKHSLRTLALIVITAAALPASVSPLERMTLPRAAHTATLLASGKVLLAGGCVADGCDLDERSAMTELYDNAARRFEPGPRLPEPRVGHVATRLRDGTVLVAGGWTASGVTASALLYQPGESRFVRVGSMSVPRGGFTATLLRDGRVLVVGGTRGGGRMLASAELYDPSTRRFVITGAMVAPRSAHAAAVAAGGRVLITGGAPTAGRVVASAELFDPRTGRFARVRAMKHPRHKHAAVELDGGRVLVVGGSDEQDWRGRYRSAEVYDPRRAAFTATAPMASPRFKLSDAIVRLPSGRVLVAGGADRVELYDARRRRFSAAGGIDRARSFSTATLLPSGDVLIAGGYDDEIKPTRGAWLYSP